MRRREFMTVIGGMTVAWPLVALAQQPVRIGLLNSGADSFFVAPFVGKLGELGYLEGKNIVIERKFAAGNSPEGVCRRPGSAACRCHCHDWDARRLCRQAGHQVQSYLARSATPSVSVLSQVFRGLAEMPPAIR